MGTSFATKSARVLVAEESATVRQLISETLRGLGFLEITVVATGKDVYNALEYDDCDWIIMPTFARQTITAFHVLKAICEIPRLRRVRVSLLVDKDDERLLPPAFHYGLLSWHPKVYAQERMAQELNRLMDVMKSHNWSATLASAEYFRAHMSEARDLQALLTVEKLLLGLFPGSLPLLLKYGETQLRAGLTPEGVGTLRQACLIDERVKPTVDALVGKHAGVEAMAKLSQPADQDILGVGTCVLIDPDTAVLAALRALLTQAGVPHVACFEDGELAWRWISQNPEPGLILQEWRIPGLTGPLLLQRIRHHGFINVPVNVISSVIRPEESHLLREFGVANVVAKPFAAPDLFKSLVWTLQQHVFPREQNSLQQKIRRLLRNGQLEEASRLKEIFLADPRIKTSCKKTIDAHVSFHGGQYRKARDLALEALRLQGDSLCLLNLIGKCLLKLGDNEAAMKVFEKAHAMSRLNIENLCLLALAQFDCGKEGESQATMRKAMALDEGNRMVGETRCQLALLGGDTTQAKSLMEELNSVQGVLAYMNNRAISLARSGRFEEGISLYQRTMEAIPARDADAKDAVTYNLGLAYARYGELRKAADALAALLSRRESKVFRKSASLMKRVTSALQDNTPLSFYETIADEHEVKANVVAIRAGGTAAEAEIGTTCLNGIYRLTHEEQARWTPLFDNHPTFTDKAVSRDIIA